MSPSKETVLKNAEAWFLDQPSKPELTGGEREALLSLIGDERMGLLWSWLYAEQLGYHSQLANIRLGNSADAATASVIQGKIHGIARVKQSLLDLLAEDPTETEK